jgi:hypothetical protein
MAKSKEEKEIEKILKKAHIKDEGWPVEYLIRIDTPFESIGKFYNMVLKELRDFKMPNIVKIDQTLSASPTSAFYADVAQRKAYAKEQVDKGMQIIGGIMQTVIKLIYSLREFDLILDIFKRLLGKDDKERIGAELNLRRIFLDEVDAKKGRGSIHNMTTAQGMEFVSLRDNFLIIKDLKSIDDLNANDRIKRILKDRFSEYEDWKKAYKKDIEGRKKIQKEFLRSQVESMKMQLEWVKPYYTLMQQLNIDTGVANPDLLAGIDTSIIKTKIRTVLGGPDAKIPSLATAFVDVDFSFKTSPVQVRGAQGQAFHHRFSTEIKYTPYVMSNEDYEKVKKVETMRDIKFLETIVGESLSAIKDDLEKYMAGEDIKKEEKEKERRIPFDFLFLPFKALVEPFIPIFKKPKDKKGKVPFSTYKLNNDLKEYSKKAKNGAFDVYENFKDENGYITWSASLG